MATAEGRRLAAVMFTDIVGYTALTQLDEAKALELLDRHNRSLRPIFPRFRGREVKSMGDSFLVEFESALDATNCALDIQRFLRQDNSTRAPEDRVRVRIGIHLGDVVHAEADVFGDSVNIASRVEPLAEREGICVTGPVHEQVANKIAYGFEKLDPKPLKNVRVPPVVYRLLLPWSGAEAPLAARTARNRIAVLPFANMSPNADDAYFADGMTEELIAVLSEAPGLRVISRTSVDPYKKRDKALRDIGAELHVDTILEGSVRRSADRLRITVQLIETDTDEHLWAARYDRKLDDIFEVQTEVARTVAENLRARLHAEVTAEVPPSHPLNPESYIEGLKGWSLLRHRTEPSVREAKARFERAIELDARNARAHVGLAIAENSVSLFTREPRADILRASRGLVERALELDPNLAEAHAYLGRLIMFEYRWEEAERELARAISLNPSSASAHGSYARLLVEEGRFEDALRELSLAEESDPLDPGPAGAQAQILTNLGRLDEARAKLQKQGELTQKGLGYQLGVAWYALTTRDFATALRHIERAEAFGPGEPESLCLRGIYYALAGRRNEAEEVLERLKGLPESKGFRNDALAQVCACLGRTEECFRYLEQGVEKREIFFSNWRGDPILAPVLNDPRFHELLERANLE